MRIPRLYTPQAVKLHQEFLLEESIAHHVATVLRIKKGREVVLFNGEGIDGKLGEFKGFIQDVNRKKVTVICTDFIEKDTQSLVNITIGACLIKNDRMDWLIQKATELGVNSITPLLSENTDVKHSQERLEKKQNHWQQVMINACEQSGRTTLVRIHSPQAFIDYVAASRADHKLILHPNTLNKNEAPQRPKTIDLLIGPEGGFTEDEVKLAQVHDFAAMTMGPRILRAETAPLAAIALMQSQFGDF